MPAVSAVEWDIIEARVRATADRYNLKSPSLAFLFLVLDQFFPNRSSEFPEMAVDGGNDLGIDAIEIIDREEHAEIFIFQSKHRTSIKSTDRTINDSEVLKVGSFLNSLFEKNARLLKTGNLQMTEAVQRIWDLHERGIICQYRLIFCTNGQGLSRSSHSIVESTVANLHNVYYEVYSAAELMRDISASSRTTESGFLQVVGKEAFERTDGDIRGVIASIDARSFVELIQTPDGKSVRRHLFDENLRIFLGANGGYNSNIIQTAASGDSHIFWYLNNGITITCRDYNYNKGHSNPKIKLDDFQIVNGAQTSHSLLEAFRQAPETFLNVVLLVRIYATSRSDIAERVAVATNSQARIQSRDLRANHPALKKLEISLQDRGYYFERKRNMHAGKDQRKRIDALKLGQILISYQLGEPDRAKAESDSIFGERFASIFHEHLNTEDLCRLVELYSIVENLRDSYMSQQRISIKQEGEHRYLVYGHWFVLYAARLIITQSGRPIPVGQEAENLILDSIALVARACSHVKSAAHYQLFRSAKTKDRIVAELEGRQMSLFDL
ncbi:MAG: AIPR family protein [Cryobacterium sp.]|uniref:AIPR family protein n=1 Tax=unclassified Chelatococcus TaxID=2638111 RepID=UPI001BD1B5D5|nr:MULTISPECIES: AIPR family protein [unclassified Chelatococcus]MBS7698054.1 AIPR family protein [Chelatococcus sp. YT9]MBX3088412.1 AIPR family protein [Cryobacterium sp.]MBX3556628.1 AIPR family protein [Chelatococcus sp.]